MNLFLISTWVFLIGFQAADTTDGTFSDGELTARRQLTKLSRKLDDFEQFLTHRADKAVMTVAVKSAADGSYVRALGPNQLPAESPAVGSVFTDQAAIAVLNAGNTYHTNVTANGINYYWIYQPRKDSSGNVIGFIALAVDF